MLGGDNINNNNNYDGNDYFFVCSKYSIGHCSKGFTYINSEFLYQPH